MLSCRRPILMRVRISFDALRLCLLVAAGVTSGYLWRAAFESASPQVKVAGTSPLVEQAPPAPVVQISPQVLVNPRRHVTPHRVTRGAGARPARRFTPAVASTSVRIA